MAIEQQSDSHFATDNRQMNEPVQHDASAADAVRQQVKSKPVSTVAVAVGVGIGAGLLLSTLFSSERSRNERLARRLGNYLGGGNLRSSIENMLPDSITDRYKS